MTYIYQSLLYQAMGYREAISDFRIRKPECATFSSIGSVSAMRRFGRPMKRRTRCRFNEFMPVCL